jgi:hypothetical protein
LTETRLFLGNYHVELVHIVDYRVFHDTKRDCCWQSGTQVTVVSKREMLVEIEWDGLVTVSAARDMTTVVSPLRNTAAPYERK